MYKQKNDEKIITGVQNTLKEETQYYKNFILKITI